VFKVESLRCINNQAVLIVKIIDLAVIITAGAETLHSCSL
jgi:hypothetical protein